MLQKAIFPPIAAALGLLWLGAVSSALAQGLPDFPQTLSPSTVLGRMPGSSGPVQAIPFATLTAQLNGLSTVVYGPASTTSGHIVLWGNTVGTSIVDTYAGSTCAADQGAISISSSGVLTCAARAATNSTVASPAGPNSTSSFKMQGLAGTITPTFSGNILITISGTMNTTSTAAGNGIKYQISYGTGSAPTTNASLAGTQVGTVQIIELDDTVTAADVQRPFSLSVVVTGLTLSTAYWIDLAAESIGANTSSLINVNIAAVEM